MNRLAVALGGYVLAALVRGPREGLVVCPWRRLTGRPCPGCGLTRSLGALGRLRVREACAHHRGGPAVLVGVLALIAVSAAQ